LTVVRRGTAVLLAVILALSPAAAAAVAADGLALDDAYTLAEDGLLTVPVDTGVLANDTGGSAVLCVSGFDTTSLQGSLGDPGVNPDGSFTYTPPPDFNGTETFTYDVSTLVAGVCPPPPASEGKGTVTITVEPVNDPPTAVADTFTVLANRTLTIGAPGVLGNDSDVDGDPLTAVKASSPAHGSVTLAADGGFSYTPNDGYVGKDAFSYRANDGTANSPQRLVNLTIAAPRPTPSPTPIPTPTPVPPTASPEPSPTESPEPSDSDVATPSPEITVAPSASPSPGPVTGPVVGPGGPPIVAIGALALLLGLLAIAGLFFIRSQSRGNDGDVQPGYVGDEEYPGGDDLGDDRT
jgi:hypothetical protein